MPSTRRRPTSGTSRAYDFRAAAAFAAAVAPRVLEPGFPRRGRPEHQRARAAPGGGDRRAGHAARPAQYNDELTLLDEQGGRRRYTIYGGIASHQREEGTDFAAIEEGAVSVTPAALRPDGHGEHGGARGAAQLAALLDVDVRPAGARDRLRPDPARPRRHGDRLRGAHPRVTPPRGPHRAGRGLGGRAPGGQCRAAADRADGGASTPTAPRSCTTSTGSGTTPTRRRCSWRVRGRGGRAARAPGRRPAPRAS